MSLFERTTHTFRLLCGQNYVKEINTLSTHCRLLKLPFWICESQSCENRHSFLCAGDLHTYQEIVKKISTLQSDTEICDLQECTHSTWKLNYDVLFTLVPWIFATCYFFYLLAVANNNELTH